MDHQGLEERGEDKPSVYNLFLKAISYFRSSKFTLNFTNSNFTLFLFLSFVCLFVFLRLAPVTYIYFLRASKRGALKDLKIFQKSESVVV